MKKAGIVAGTAAVVVLAAATIVVMNLDTSGKDEAGGTSAELHTVLALDDAQTITVSSENLDIKYIKAEDSEVWLVDGMAPSDISAAKMGSFISGALYYSTYTLLEDGELSEYGLDNPALTVTIEAEDGEHIIMVGDRSAVDDVYFAIADGTLFTMAASQYELLMTEASYYSEFERISINPDNISGIKIETADRTLDLYIPDITRLEGNVWMMREPYESMANDSYLDSDVLEQIGAITLTRKAESIGTEQAVLTVTEGDTVYRLKIGDTEGGTTYVEYNGEAFAESAELFAFIGADTFSYINKLVSYVNIQDISEMTAEYDGKTHTFGVNGSGTDLSYTADGEEADTDAAKKCYQTIIGVIATGFYNNETMGETVLRLDFKSGDGSTVVEYKRINEYTVAAVKNGAALFITGNADVENVKAALDGFFEGE